MTARAIEAAPRPLALVTGGCRRMGAAIGAALAAAGHDLAVHGTHADPDPALLAAIAAAGVAWAPFTADLSDGAAVAALVPHVIARFGRAPAVLVNNAARFDYDLPETATQAGLLDHYAVNAAAPVLLSQAFAREAAPGAAIVNILDQRIAAPNADQFSYTLSKLALSEATAILARRFAPHVRVCAVAPGLTLPAADYRRRAARRRRAPHAARPAARARRRSRRRCCSWSRARAITGQTIFVDARRASLPLRARFPVPGRRGLSVQLCGRVRPQGPSPASTTA